MSPSISANEAAGARLLRPDRVLQRVNPPKVRGVGWMDESGYQWSDPGGMTATVLAMQGSLNGVLTAR